jgi:uncharacterized protein YbjT (DUF2867 family)
MSPLHVKDVATVFVKALDMPETAGQIYELCGPVALPWNDILQMIAAATGTTKVALPAPAMLLKVLAAALDQYAFFPITREQLTMLMQGNTCGGQDAFETFGLEPAPFNTTGLAYLLGND